MNQQNSEAKQENHAQLSTSDTESISKVPQIGDKSVPNNIKLCMPQNLSRIVTNIAEIVQAHEDSIATNLLTTLTPLTAKTRLLDYLEDNHGSPIILYTGFFTKSGGGKTGVMRKLQYYLLGWLEALYTEEQKEQDQRQKKLEGILKSLGNSKEDRIKKAQIQEQLASLKPMPDLFLEDSTPEGLEQSISVGSSPMMYIDNFGQYLSSAGKSESKAGLLRTLDNIFDSGKMTTRRLKGEAKRASQLNVSSFGVHLTSTIGESNLKPQDIIHNIENGFLNKVIITFQDSMDKDIPLISSLPKEVSNDIERFSKHYYSYARQSLFYLGNHAIRVYREFHQETSKLYRTKYNDDEDSAGYIIRQLHIAKRIAVLFEIATQCESLPLSESMNITPLEFEKRNKIEVSATNMQLAINFLKYIQREHLEKIMLYGRSSNGKLSIEDTIYIKAKKIIAEGSQLSPRKFHQKLSKAQRKKVGSVDDLRKILHHLILQDKLKLKDIDVL